MADANMDHKETARLPVSLWSLFETKGSLPIVIFMLLGLNCRRRVGKNQAFGQLGCAAKVEKPRNAAGKSLLVQSDKTESG
jgi:hypothetical protein